MHEIKITEQRCFKQGQYIDAYIFASLAYYMYKKIESARVILKAKMDTLWLWVISSCPSLSFKKFGKGDASLILYSYFFQL